jgi:virginiamycin B lyase
MKRALNILATAALAAASSLAAEHDAKASGLPAGDGVELVEAMCTACHNLNPVINSMGYSPEDWRELIATMIDLEGTEELDEIVAYLGENLPPSDNRAPNLIEGDIEITFTEWVSPTPGQRTRDPIEAPDGSIWWTGQWADLVGRIDPATGEMEEFMLPPGARAHTVTADAQGRIWYTGNGNATMGYLDPATGVVTEFPMPDPAARDPHSAIVDPNGIVWFTLQRSNMIGSVDPETGEVRLVEAPTPNSRPYGIKLSSEGVPWIAANGSNRLYRLNPETMEIEEHELPDTGTTVRRLDFAADDTIWYVNSALGRLGHYDPRTGEAREWDSPSGPRSHPYAIAVIDDIVWYNESGQRPDTLVRFDPDDESFQSWAIPSGGVHAGIVRHMRPTRDGDLLIHQSSTNRVIRVTVADGS